MTLHGGMLGHGEDESGYARARDTRLAGVLPYRVLEFQRR
jgi:hypothetical protein